MESIHWWVWSFSFDFHVNLKNIQYFQTYPLSASKRQHGLSLTMHFTGRTFKWLVALPGKEWLRCWVMSSFIPAPCDHSPLTAVREIEQAPPPLFWLFSRVLASYFIHGLINCVKGGSQTYLWLKLFSFLRQWRVTTLWPSLLTSWLTVHATGLLALAPRKAMPSFSLTLQREGKKKTNIKLLDTGTVRRKAHKLSFRDTHGLFCSFAGPDTHTNMSERNPVSWSFNCLSQRSENQRFPLSHTNMQLWRKVWFLNNSKTDPKHALLKRN